MQFLAENWFFVIVLILFVVMHLLRFGCDCARGSGHPGAAPRSQSRGEVPHFGQSPPDVGHDGAAER